MNPLAWAIENMRQARDKSLGVDPGVTPSRARIIAPPQPERPIPDVTGETMRFMQAYPTPEDFYGAVDEYYGGGPGDDVLRGGGARDRIAGEIENLKAKLAANYVDEPTPEVAAMIQRNADFDARGGDLPDTFYRPPGRELGLPEMTRFAGRDQGDRAMNQNARVAAAERLQAMQGASNAPLTHQDLADRDRMLAVSVPGQGVELSKAATGTTPGDIGYRDKRTSVERDEDRRLARMRKHGRMMDVNPLLVPFWDRAQAGDPVAGAMFAGGVGMGEEMVPAAMAEAERAKQAGMAAADRLRLMEQEEEGRNARHAAEMAIEGRKVGLDPIAEAILRVQDPSNPPQSEEEARQRNETIAALKAAYARQNGGGQQGTPQTPANLGSGNIYSILAEQQKLDAMYPPADQQPASPQPVPTPPVTYRPYTAEEDAMLRRVFEAKSKRGAWESMFNVDYSLDDFLNDAREAGFDEAKALEWAKKNLANKADETDPDPRLTQNKTKSPRKPHDAAVGGAVGGLFAGF